MNDHLIRDNNDQALRALAFVVNAVRPDWDRPGVLAKLNQATAAGKPLGQLAVAAIRAALDESNRTPAVIPLDGAHWRDTPAPRLEVTPVPKPYRPDPVVVGDAERGAAAARALLRASRTANTEVTS
jgi:hypothetical protein